MFVLAEVIFGSALSSIIYLLYLLHIGIYVSSFSLYVGESERIPEFALHAHDGSILFESYEPARVQLNSCCLPILFRQYNIYALLRYHNAGRRRS